MTSLLRRFAATAIAACGISLPASASTTFSTDWTDLWFNPAESGWGINLVQQYDTIFATIFVYGGDRQPHWFVASSMTGGGNSFSGQLFQISGAPFSAPWTGIDPVQTVGTISVSFNSNSTGTLTYTVNGATIIKSIQRQTFRGNNLGGNYIGGMVGTASNCTSSGNNGPVLAAGLFNVQHSNFTSGGTVTIRVDFQNNTGTPGVCTYTGSHVPAGSIGTISGSYNCSIGTAATSGTFTMAQVQATRNGLNATYSANDNLGCSYSGFFGGVRDTI